ncbi:MAG TPA: maltose alpha-D-glucosyltransferase, partial [Burkholderiaceae bacterium]|nr:maltose alpha-D-glucosyltransferase [Burkholderiaceae bacterium]
PTKYKGTRIIFTDTEVSNWAWDSVAQSYYWHRFFSHQPDLNFDNPHVLKAVLRTMRFWLDMGVDGFRLDAIPYLVEREGTNNENLPETHAVIKQIRAEIDAHYRNRMLLAEANQWPEDVREYFGDGDECHVAYHFPLMPRLFMALAMEDRHPVIEIMQQTPEIPEPCQWAIFLRNHDELTLEMVTDRERDYMYKIYATDPRMRVNVGIRRRLAPLMENDRQQIELMTFLLMTMPGTPVVYYGDEIGMGDNIFLGDRNGVRTPMQWSPDRNAGFSRADPQRLYLPPIMDPVYGYEAVNVEAQLRSNSSLLNWTRRLIAVRKTYRAFGRGRLRFLTPGNRKILAYLREWQDETILCVVNLSRHAQACELDLSAFAGRVPIEINGRIAFPPIAKQLYMLSLSGRGYMAFCLTRDASPPDWYSVRSVPEDLSVMVLFDGWRSFFRDRVVPWRIGMAEQLRQQFERNVMPKYASAQRWFASKGTTLQRMPVVDHAEWTAAPGSPLLALFRAETDAGDQGTYFVPLS